MKQRPLVLVNNHVERANIKYPSPSIITHEALDKLAFAMRRCENKYSKIMHKARVPENWTMGYIEELTPDRCVFVVVFGYGIDNPVQEHIKYEVNTDELLKDLTPERIIE